MKTLSRILFLAVFSIALTSCSDNGPVSVDGSDVLEHSSLFDTMGPEKVVTLYAGQDIDVGTVSVVNNDNEICVEYAITKEGWLIHATHLAIAKDLDGIPINNGGNPQIGQFPYGEDELGGVESWDVCVPFDELDDVDFGDTVFIAAHAVVTNQNQLAEGEEFFYLSSSRPRDVIGDEERPGSEIFRVVFDDVNKEGNLELLITLGENFDQVDAMAATPDGEYLYFYDKESDHLGRYEVDSKYFEDLGLVEDAPEGRGVVLATFSPDGTLYVASQITNNIYTIDTSIPKASIVGNTGIDVLGADMAFDANGVLYLYSNSMNALHTINLVTGNATYVGSGLENLTGVAFREGGLTDLVGSLSGFRGGIDGEFVLFDREANEMYKYPMLLDGEQIIYTSGDMATGFIGEPSSDSAWGDGTPFTERGGSWAMYFEYEIK